MGKKAISGSHKAVVLVAMANVLLLFICKRQNRKTFALQ